MFNYIGVQLNVTHLWRCWWCWRCRWRRCRPSSPHIAPAPPHTAGSPDTQRGGWCVCAIIYWCTQTYPFGVGSYQLSLLCQRLIVQDTAAENTGSLQYISIVQNGCYYLKKWFNRIAMTWGWVLIAYIRKHLTFQWKIPHGNCKSVRLWFYLFIWTNKYWLNMCDVSNPQVQPTQSIHRPWGVWHNLAPWRGPAVVSVWRSQLRPARSPRTSTPSSLHKEGVYNIKRTLYIRGKFYKGVWNLIGITYYILKNE